MDDRLWTIPTQFKPDEQTVLQQFFTTPMPSSIPSAASPTLILPQFTASTTPVDITWLSTHRQALNVGPITSQAYKDCKEFLDRRTEPSSTWNPKHSLTTHDQLSVMNFIHQYSAYKTDGGIRNFMQNLTTTVIFGLKCALTQVKPIDQWSKDDDEAFIAAVLFHYGGNNVAQRMPAADILNRLAIKSTNDKFVEADVLKLQAKFAQSICENPVSMAGIGIEAQVNLLIENSWPLGFQHDLKTRVSHLTEWGPIWNHYNELVKEYVRANQIEALRAQLLPQTLLMLESRSPTKLTAIKTPDKVPLASAPFTANKAIKQGQTHDKPSKKVFSDHNSADCINCKDTHRYSKHPHISENCLRHCKNPKCQEKQHLHKSCPRLATPSSNSVIFNTDSSEDEDDGDSDEAPQLVLPNKDKASKHRVNSVQSAFRDPIKAGSTAPDSDNIRYMYDSSGNREIVYMYDSDEETYAPR